MDASVESYDDVLLTLLADAATNYLPLRTIEPSSLPRLLARP